MDEVRRFWDRKGLPAAPPVTEPDAEPVMLVQRRPIAARERSPGARGRALGHAGRLTSRAAARKPTLQAGAAA